MSTPFANDHSPTIDDIRIARRRIASHLRRTPVITCQLLNQLTGSRIFFKCENLQKQDHSKPGAPPTPCFRFPMMRPRAGLPPIHRATTPPPSPAPPGSVVSGRISSCRATPDPINSAPVRSHGIDPVICEPTLEAREAATAALIAKTGAMLIHPYDDARIIAGQATATLEFLEQVPDLDVLIVPVGGGGLLSGAAIAARAVRPELIIIAAEPAFADDAYRSMEAGARQSPTRTDTIADGLRTGLGDLNWPIIHNQVDHVLIASEEAIVDATRQLLEFAKCVVEPSGAVGLAVLTENPPPRFAAKNIGVILSGGNLDLDRPPWLKRD